MPIIKRISRNDGPSKQDAHVIQKTKPFRHFHKRGTRDLSMAVPAEKSSHSENASTPSEAEHVKDARDLSATELRMKYRTTYDSWRNMKQRSKGPQNAIIAPEFESFASFLRIMGPRPTPAYTLDRKDNKNSTYGPGLCEWRDKSAQANNRSSTIFLTHNGECQPLTVWAQRTGQKADTLRRRKHNGWTDEQTVTGKRAKSETTPAFQWPGRPGESQEVWERAWLASGYNDRLNFVVDTLRKKLAELERATAGYDGDPACNIDAELEAYQRVNSVYLRYHGAWKERERLLEAKRRERLTRSWLRTGSWPNRDDDGPDDK